MSTSTSPAPFTVMIFTWRLPSVTPAEFKDHYENKHMPLIQSLTGSLFPESHTRYYVQRTSLLNAEGSTDTTAHPASVLVGTQEDFTYDALAELKFKDEEAFQIFFAKCGAPEVAAQVAEDEKMFLQRSKMIAAVFEAGFVTKRL